jgi:hypothetical protein
MKHFFANGAVLAALTFVICTSASATTPPPGYVLQETITVPLDGSNVTSTTSLVSGKTYLLRASGTANISTPTPGNCGLTDAEFARFEPDNTCSLPGTPADSTGGYDLGIGINSPIASNTKGVTWGTTFNTTHQYTVPFTGTGAPISLNFHDNVYNDNSGTLTVEIFAPQAANAAIPTLSEWGMILLASLVAFAATARLRRMR